MRAAIARLGGTFVGAALATLVAMTLRPDGIWLSVLIVLSMYLAYALQNVNYALYAVPLTSYIAFILAVGRTPEAITAVHRVLATAIAGAIAMLIHAVYVHDELRRIARTFLPRRRCSRGSASIAANAVARIKVNCTAMLVSFCADVSPFRRYGAFQRSYCTQAFTSSPCPTASPRSP